MVEVMLMMLPPPECSSISGTAAEVNACAVETLKVKASRRSFVDVLSSGAGMVPPTLLTTTSSSERLDRGLHKFGRRIRVGEVGNDDVSLAAGAGDLTRHLVELRLRTGRNHHIRTGFSERERDRGTEATARARHDRNLVVEAESVQDQHVLLSLTAVTLAA